MPTTKINQLIQLEDKHPGARRIYTVNLASPDGTNDGSSSDIGFLQGRTITGIVVTKPSGITLENSTNDTTTFTLDISGGVAGTPYEFDTVVTLSTAEIEPVTLVLPVTDVGNN